ncbi:MAG: hypothetical protein NWE97_02185 [Candidatus Bathyarchaeota archaeon]|nr:hypothetical protein [Candidatus Bathyarchaeota archaeon]
MKGGKTALTGYLYLQGKTEVVGDEDDGNILVPTEGCWRRRPL